MKGPFRREIDDVRRAKGYVYGARQATSGDCWMQCYQRRCTAHFVDFLCHVDEQFPANTVRTYAILDNLEMRRCRDLLFFWSHQPR